MRDDGSRSSILVDLGGLSLEMLGEIEDHSLRRALEPLFLETAEPTAGFTSSI
ncbi:hypothetical protein ACIBF6_16820 [Streptosporangium amethystogenes]|uniref:hypothetical protein n=1 Tax=Streptosporangium amethystogenes TaxID=2002 RepID=UPI003787F306